MKLTMRAWRHDLVLVKPYRLSFATLPQFETNYIAVEGEGRTGYGEVSPLPGYGGETIEQSTEALAEAGRQLAMGKPVAEVIAGLVPDYPMTASGLACAFETWKEGEAVAFNAPISDPVPLAALCAGNTPEAMAAEAKRLASTGSTVFKLKTGREPGLEESLTRAAAKELPAGGTMRLDANQAYAPGDALELCRRLEDMGGFALLEQPFKPDMWEECAKLAASTTFPLMTDESVWSKEDIHRSKECGAKYVKLKLCKHPGMAASVALIEEARSLGLGIVYGNGVQTALGNHLEARVHRRCGLKTATEANGFLKVKEHPFQADMTVEDGMIIDHGLRIDQKALARGKLIVEAAVTGEV